MRPSGRKILLQTHTTYYYFASSWDFLLSCTSCSFHCSAKVWRISILTILIATSHVIYLLNPRKSTPLSVFFSAPSKELPTYVSNLFAVIHLSLHLNLILLSWPAEDRPILQDIQLLSYQITIACVAVAPCLALIMGRSLDVITWWSVALVVGVAQYYAQRWMAQGTLSIEELEGMRYAAKGA